MNNNSNHFYFNTAKEFFMLVSKKQKSALEYKIIKHVKKMHKYVEPYEIQYKGEIVKLNFSKQFKKEIVLAFDKRNERRIRNEPINSISQWVVLLKRKRILAEKMNEAYNAIASVTFLTEKEKKEIADKKISGWAFDGAIPAKAIARIFRKKYMQFHTSKNKGGYVSSFYFQDEKTKKTIRVSDHYMPSSNNFTNEDRNEKYDINIVFGNENDMINFDIKSINI